MPSVTRFDDPGLPGPPVRGWLHRPADAHAGGLVLAHGAGGNAEAPVLVEMAAAFTDAGWTVLRCDLPLSPGAAYRAARRAGGPNATARDSGMP